MESQGDSAVDLDSDSGRELAGLFQGTDRSTGRLTPTVSCRARRKATCLVIRRATRRRTWKGTCEVNLTGSLGSPSPETVACPEVTGSGDWPLTDQTP